MSWVKPTTRATGDLITAAIWNTDIVNNVLVLGKVGALRHEMRAATAVETLVDSAWLELNEVDVSRTTYPDLWTLFGTTLARTYSGTTTLGAAISSTSATSVTLAAWPTNWPTSGRKFLIQVDSEKMLVTAGFGTTSVTVTRGVEGTTAATHTNGTSVSAPSQSPFGHGDGSTTFTLAGAGGRMLIAAASGGHADVASLGNDDGVVLAYRHPKHRHTPHSHSVNTLPAGSTEYTGSTTPRWNTGSASTGSADGGSGVSTDPLDAPAYLVAGVWLVKALA